jgi:cyanophycinase
MSNEYFIHVSLISNMLRKTTITLIFLSLLFSLNAQTSISAKGCLFIIGGGHRSPALMKTLLAVSSLKTKDYIVVLPMASEQTDTSYYYVKASLVNLCSNTISNLDFSKHNKFDQQWLDSLEHAKLIFICGGDQSRFMKNIENTPIQAVIQKAYQNGSTIAGTSAGAAVMSKYMITGNQLSDTTYHETFRRIHANDLEIKPGLGLLPDAIIDQHFVVRSRYNRLFVALAYYPKLPCIGIDEATAIIVHGNSVKVTGESQVIVLRNPVDLKIENGKLIKFKDVEMSIYTAGDEFKLR